MKRLTRQRRVEIRLRELLDDLEYKAFVRMSNWNTEDATELIRDCAKELAGANKPKKSS